jgi:septal ring factor EnvC (AmiA/AmiB activator)
MNGHEWAAAAAATPWPPTPGSAAAWPLAPASASSTPRGQQHPNQQQHSTLVHTQQQQQQHQQSQQNQNNAALAQVVEQLERDLSRREAAERRLAQELDAAKADVEERDQSIADMCSTWERTMAQLRAARDEDVALARRLRQMEEGEVPALRAAVDDAEARAARSAVGISTFLAGSSRHRHGTHSESSCLEFNGTL